MKTLILTVAIAAFGWVAMPSGATAQPKLYPRKCVAWMKWGKGMACTKYVSTGPRETYVRRKIGPTAPK